jgi:hypothetical protein
MLQRIIAFLLSLALILMRLIATLSRGAIIRTGIVAPLLVLALFSLFFVSPHQNILYFWQK